ncbi:hypothetical protein MTO96_007946 [Rhipicephalus appendiculatus]
MGLGSSSDSVPLPEAHRSLTTETTPSTTPRTVASTPPPISTTERTTAHVTVIARTTVSQAPPSTPPPPPPPPLSDSSIKPQSLLCTFGYMTTYRTKYPADGVCDYIFYDSMYKNYRNTLLGIWGQNYRNTLLGIWGQDVQSILTKALQTDRTKTQFGIGFAFEHRYTLIQDLANASLKNFWEHNVFHFGILDCPAHGTKQADMDEVFVALKALDGSVQRTRTSGNASFIVLGAVSHTGAWNNYYRDKFGGVF